VTLFPTLQERGFVAEFSGEGVPDYFAWQRFTVYAGFDPTADSLHLGHLVPGALHLPAKCNDLDAGAHGTDWRAFASEVVEGVRQALVEPSPDDCPSRP
jgi:hypothetical protein